MGWIQKIIDNKTAAFQADLMQKHFEEVQNMYAAMRGWRHDYHNHIQAMKACAEMGKTGELAAYLDRLETDLTTVDTVVKTGNVMLDAILNSKLSLAQKRGIAVNVKASVPQNLTISDVDLCVILGNLLDNAMEACMPPENAEIPKDFTSFIRIYIGMKNTQLYLSVTNSSLKAAKKNGENFITGKGAGHGFGLSRVGKICERYGGYFKRNAEPGAFTAEILLPQ